MRDSRPDSVLIPEDYEYNEEDGTPLVGDYDMLDVNSILGLDGEIDIPDDVLEENENTEEEDNIIEDETHTHNYMEGAIEETTVMAVEEEEEAITEEDSDDYQYVTTESSIYEDEDIHQEAVGENKTAPVTESTLVEEHDEIIIGIDYSDRK